VEREFAMIEFDKIENQILDLQSHIREAEKSIRHFQEAIKAKTAKTNVWHRQLGILYEQKRSLADELREKGRMI
jgi:predicted  nucleic acid-binding Zn-ribbon protein